MEGPLVSIITITYNRADLIHRCIESIQHQTYKNYEHIIVDGNSSDNTQDVVCNYHDSHIKYIKLDRNGSIQLKKGAEVASGKYITFLDDDDEYLPEKIEKQVRLFETLTDDYGVVYCWMSYYNNDDPEKVIRVHKPELRGDVSEIAPTKPIICGTPTMMIRRDVFNKYGISYSDDVGYLLSDWELMTRIVQHCKVDFLPESLIKVYVNHGHARQTTDFYGDKARKGIKFHSYFLKTWEDIFKRNPDSAGYHYYNLAICHAKLNQWGLAMRWYGKFLKTHPSFKEVIKVLGRILLRR